MTRKKIYSKILTPVLAGVCAAFASPVYLQAEQWVRITVTDDGIYSLSYDKLKEMGFANPEKVGIIGRGGVALPVAKEDFNLGQTIVPVLHFGNTLYFYGKGPANMAYYNADGANAPGYYRNLGVNTNTEYGYYYLTDSEGFRKDMEENSVADASEKLSRGVRFIHHEEDLFQNTTNTGNLFWGESFNAGNPSTRSWDIDLSDAAPDSKAVFDLSFYSEKGETGDITISSNKGKIELKGAKATKSNYTPLTYNIQSIDIGRGNEKISIKYDFPSNKYGIANLDYWTLSYTSDLSNIGKEKGRLTSYPDVKSGESAVIPCTSTANLKAFDVTDYTAPLLLVETTGKDGFVVSNNGKTPRAIVINTSDAQNEISDWVVIDHDPTLRPLHAKASSTPQMLIIAPKEFLNHASKINELHQRYDGISIFTASIEDIYEEFSGGLPDPESYRRFVDTFYSGSSIKPENLLLLGMVTNDARRSQKAYGYASRHILPQASSVHFERGAYGVMDYFVALEPTPSIDNLERETLHLGIGLLPFNTLEDGDRYLKKLETFMFSTDLASYMNDWMFIGGLGDEHTHDQQCVDLYDMLQTASATPMVSMLVLDAYGSVEAGKKLVENLNAGKGLTLYFGHLSNVVFGKEFNFFTAEDIRSLNNNNLTFIITAGCTASSTDSGKRGLGDEWVIGSNAGAIGGIISSRETWSAQNFDFVNSFLNHLTDSSKIGSALTIGEIYMLTKNDQENTNDNALVLMCDPSLRLPLLGGGIELKADNTITPGKAFKLEGEVKGSDGQTDYDFNGKIYFKLAEPEIVMRSPDYETSGQNGDVVLDVPYGDVVCSQISGTIKNGKFTVNLPSPASLAAFQGKNVKLYASAFDNENQSSATLVKELTVGSATEADNASSGDTTPPSINDIWIDNAAGYVFVSVSDDNSLSLSAFSTVEPTGISFDGRQSPYYKLSPESFTEDNKNAILKCRIPELSQGSHDVAVTVSDAAGNFSSRSIGFELKPFDQTIILETDRKALTDECVFIVNGASKSAEVNIYDFKGNLVASVPVAGSNVRWNGTDSNGNKLAVGLYRAVVKEKRTDKENNSFSNTIYVPII